MSSTNVIIEAPLSFAGSAKRINRLSDNPAVRMFVLWPTIALAWGFVFCWYCVFGVFLVPYRLVRRGQRRTQRDAMRHDELLAAAARLQH